MSEQDLTPPPQYTCYYDIDGERDEFRSQTKARRTGFLRKLLVRFTHEFLYVWWGGYSRDFTAEVVA